MIKRTIAIASVVLLASFQAFAQLNVQDAASKAAEAIAAAEDVKAEEVKPQYWDKGTVVSLGFTNTSLHNWAAGGYNTVTLASALDAKANYKKDLMTWNNRALLDYGFQYASDKPIIQKSTDRIKLESTWGYKTGAKSKFSYTASFDFTSQFANSFKYTNPGGENPSRKDWIDKRTLQSGLFSPAYTNVALGIEWVPKPWFTLNFAPLTGGFTIVSDPSLRKNYSMELLDEYLDVATPEGKMYRSARFQFGAQMKMNFKASINDVLTYETQLVLFSDYLHNPQDLRVNWDNQIKWQLAKYFAVAFKTWLIYDPNVLIDGTQKVQFKEFLQFNFTYTFKK